MRIGEVAERLGMPASTIRYYERAGLLARPRRVSGRRAFDADAVVTLRFIKLAQSAGFTIAEMKALLRNYDQNADPSSMWHALALAKREQVTARINELRHMEQVLDALLGCTCPSLPECVRAATDDAYGFSP